MANITTGNALIDFNLPASDGQTYNAYQYLKGATALILVFTTTHCSYVQSWEERINTLARNYVQRDVRMLAIDPGEAASYPPNSPDNMAGPVAQMAYIFPYLLDESQEVARAYGAQVTPEFSCSMPLVSCAIMEQLILIMRMKTLSPLATYRRLCNNIWMGKL